MSRFNPYGFFGRGVGISSDLIPMDLSILFFLNFRLGSSARWVSWKQHYNFAAEVEPFSLRRGMNSSFRQKLAAGLPNQLTFYCEERNTRSPAELHRQAVDLTCLLAKTGTRLLASPRMCTTPTNNSTILHDSAIKWSPTVSVPLEHSPTLLASSALQLSLRASRREILAQKQILSPEPRSDPADGTNKVVPTLWKVTKQHNETSTVTVTRATHTDTSTSTLTVTILLRSRKDWARNEYVFMRVCMCVWAFECVNV